MDYIVVVPQIFHGSGFIALFVGKLDELTLVLLQNYDCYFKLLS